MKSLGILLVSLLLCSCDLGNTPERAPDHGSTVNDEQLVTLDFELSYRLTDTSGVEKTKFRSGEDFLVTLAITNLTREPQIYAHTGPVVIFSVLLGDSTIATSVDGLAWPQNVIVDTLGVAQTLTFLWRGPNSPARIPRRSLAPGYYTVAAVFRTVFGGHEVSDPKPLSLLVE
jgi:hypothetical protein